MEATTRVLGSVTSSTIQLGSTVINATGTGIINTTNSIATIVGLQQPDDDAEEPGQQAAAADGGDYEAGEEEVQNATESQRPKSLKERAVARVLTPARAVQSRLTEIARSQAEAAREAPRRVARSDATRPPLRSVWRRVSPGSRHHYEAMPTCSRTRPFASSSAVCALWPSRM